MDRDDWTPAVSPVVTTLEECVKARIDLWAFCRECGRARRKRTKELVLKFDFVSLEAAAKRMWCENCNMHYCILIPGRRWAGR